MSIGNSVDDQIKAPLRRLHLRRLGGQHDAIGTQSTGIRLLAGRAREERHLGTQGLGQLEPHVSQAAQSDDGHPAPRTELPMPQRRPLIPAQSSGAAPAGSSPAGTFSTNLSEATIRCE